MERLDRNTTLVSRIEYFDILRALAIIDVVAIHVSAGYLDTTTNVTNLGLLSYLVFNKLSRFCVPIFFMISGALFLDIDRDITISKIFKKYVLRIIIAFLTFSFVYALIGYLTTESGERNIQSLIANFLVGHYHMWFLFAIVGLYVMTPIFRTFVRSKEITIYYLVICGIITSVLPAALSILPQSGTTVIKSIFSDLAISLPQWSFYYILGYMLHTTKPEVSKGKIIFLICFIALFITIVGCFFAKQDAYKYLCWDYSSPIIAILSSLIFILCQKSFTSTPKLVKLLSECSFGIYLIHDIFIKLLNDSVLNIEWGGYC